MIDASALRLTLAVLPGGDMAWLDALREHAVFRGAASEHLQKSNAVRRRRLAVRGTDLIVAVGREIRLTNLADVKRLERGGDSSYKVGCAC